MKENIKIAVIDYIQMFGNNTGSKNDTQELQMGEVSRRAKNLAKEFDICIIVLSQLNRDTAKKSMDRIRDSGQIADAADIILTIKHCEGHENYPGT